MTRKPRALCRPRFKLTKILVDDNAADAEIAAYEFSFRTPGIRTKGGRKTVVLTLAQIDELPDLKKMLHGCRFSASAAGTTFTTVQRGLNRLAASRRTCAMRPWYIAPASGWWPAGYLLRDRPVPAKARLMLDPRAPRGGRLALAKSGSLKGWRRVLKRLCCSSAVIAAVSAGASAALLPFRTGATAAGYALVFLGLTSRGKTFATRVAQSLVGDPRRLLPFRASEAGLEQVAQAYRHIPLVLDEPRSTRGSHRDAAAHLAYLVEGGETAILHSLWQGSGARVETVVITGAEAGSFGERSAGEAVRFVAVPVGPMGRFGIIDRHAAAGVTDAASAKRLILRAQAGLEAHHGHGLEVIVAHAAAQGAEEVTHRVDAGMAEFAAYAAERLGPTDAAGLRVRDVIAFFYAGGAFGVDAGTLPWTKELIRESLLNCLRWYEGERARPSSRSPAALSGPARNVVAALRQVAGAPCVASKAMLKKHGAVHDRKAKQVRATDAFLRRAAGGKREAKEALDDLAGEGVVVPGDAPGRWPRQVRYPDGRSRVVCFDPRVLVDGALGSPDGAASPAGDGGGQPQADGTRQSPSRHARGAKPTDKRRRH